MGYCLKDDTIRPLPVGHGDLARFGVRDWHCIFCGCVLSSLWRAVRQVGTIFG